MNEKKLKGIICRTKLVDVVNPMRFLYELHSQFIRVNMSRRSCKRLTGCERIQEISKPV